MRKDEYLNCMAQELKQYDKAYVDEIIGDYEEHFREGMEMGKSEEGEECFVGAGLAGLKRINFSAGAADIRVIRSRDDRFYVYTEDPDDGKYLVHKRRGEDYCGGVKKETKSGSLGAQIWSVISSALISFIGKITLEVPESVEEILVDTTCGDVAVKDIKCKELRVNCTSGDVSVKETEGQKILLIANNGDAKFHHVKAEKLEIKSVNGDLKLKNVTGKEIWASSVNGDIQGNKLDANIVNVKAVRGDMKLKNGYQVTPNDMQRADMENKVKVTACTVSGDITISGE